MINNKGTVKECLTFILGTVAFQADLDSYTSIPAGSVVVFKVVDLNIGDG